MVVFVGYWQKLWPFAFIKPFPAYPRDILIFVCTLLDAGSGAAFLVQWGFSAVAFTWSGLVTSGAGASLLTWS